MSFNIFSFELYSKLKTFGLKHAHGLIGGERFSYYWCKVEISCLHSLRKYGFPCNVRLTDIRAFLIHRDERLHALSSKRGCEFEAGM